MKLKLIIICGLVFFVIAQSFITNSLVLQEESADMLTRLSGYHIFTGNLQDLVPAQEFKPYELATSLFTDYAEKQRLVKIPAGTSMKAINDGLPEFPDGTILVKTFYYFYDKRDSAKGKRIIETRVMVRSNSKWNAGTYIWNTQQTEAILSGTGSDIDIKWIDENGINKALSYHVPNNKECAGCHNSNNIFNPIGPKIRNLNIDVIRNDAVINQLTYFSHAAIMEPIDPASFKVLPNWQGSSYSLEERARAYLDVNCGHCHNPNGSCASSKFYTSYETPFSATGIDHKKSRIVNLMKKGTMPKLGATVIHKEGIALIEAYIKSLQ